MFLIEYSDGCFVDGYDIQWLKVGKDKISFILKSNTEQQFNVDEKHQKIFVNNLQAINNNIGSVEMAYTSVQSRTLND